MKKNDKLLKMMNDLDEAYIEEAEKTRFLTKTAGWKRVSSIAASLALVAAICTFPIWGQFDNPEIGHEVNLENLESKEIVWDAKTGVFTLKNYDHKLLSFGGYGTGSTTEVTTTTSAELIIEGREDISVDIKATPNVLYPYITGDYASYTMARGRVMEDKVGEKLGKVTMAGADGKTLGAIGLLGPARMDYARVLATLEEITDNVSAMLRGNALTDGENKNGGDSNAGE